MSDDSIPTLFIGESGSSSSSTSTPDSSTTGGDSSGGSPPDGSSPGGTGGSDEIEIKIPDWLTPGWAIVIGLIGLLVLATFIVLMILLAFTPAFVILLVILAVIIMVVVGGGGGLLLAGKSGGKSDGAKGNKTLGATASADKTGDEDDEITPNEIVKDVRGIGPFAILKADRVRVFRNELVADLNSDKGWSVNGWGGKRLALGFPLVMSPIADLDLSEKKLTLSPTVNPGGEAYTCDCLLKYCVAQTTENTVEPAVARALLTKLDTAPAEIIKEQFDATYNTALTVTGDRGARVVTDSTRHTPANFGVIDRQALHIMRTKMAPYGIHIVSVDTQSIRNSAAETAAETKAVLKAVNEELPDSAKGWAAGATILTQGLRPIVEAIFGGKKRSGGDDSGKK